MRLFAAVRPPADVLDHLARALDLVHPAASSGPGPLRWTAPENRHLTLAFYGEVADGAVEEVREALDEVASTTPPFALELHGAGVFSGRTVWIGASGDLDAMAALTAGAVAVGEDVLGRRDDRIRSRPHLTVARASQRTGRSEGGRRRREPLGDLVSQVVHALALYTGPRWTVDEVLLVRSRPGEGRGGGPLYDDVAVLPLAAEEQRAR